jgi:hypothetical protein
MPGQSEHDGAVLSALRRAFFRYPRWPRWIVYAVLLVVLATWLDPIVRYGYWGTKQAVAYVVNIWASGGP